MATDKKKMLDKISLISNGDFIKKIYFAGFSEKPETGIIQVTACDRFICNLAGRKKVTVSIGNKPVSLELLKGEVLYCPSYAWVKPDWGSVHEMISIVFTNHCIRSLYIDHKGKIDFPPVDFFYHTDHAFDPPGVMLLHSLNEMDDHPKYQKPALDILQAIIELTVLQIEESSQYTEESKARITWREVSQYLSEHATEDIGRDQVAKVFDLTPSYLSRLFKRFSKMTFQHYLDEIRMQLAEKLLRQKGFSIKNIAKQCGYNSSSYFIRTFRKYYKMSPGEFKKIQKT